VLRKDLEAVEARVNSTASNVNGNQPPSGIGADGGLQSDFATTGIQSQNSSFNTQNSNSDEKQSKSKELTDRRTEYGVAWIVYMRFARRAENLKSARAVFGKSRRDKWTPWEVFEAAGARLVILSYLANLY
jgi:cleavage stimulation factor subunit 3